MNDQYFMQQAIKMAHHAEQNNEVPVGAVCVFENEIIAQGKNQLIADNNPTAHAEILALIEVGKKQKNYRFPDVTLYVTLEPCTMCVGAMPHARIERIVFGAYDYKTGACGSKFDLLKKDLHNHNIKVEGGMLEEECSTLLSNFFKRRRLEKKGL
jgi:tRNA(adenine34) deaminase